MMKASELEGELYRLMAAGAGGDLDDSGFDRLARAVFALQFEGNTPYRAFCERRGKTPATVGRWTDIPCVPTRAFKELELISHPDPTVRVFETSGTTEAVRGRHLLSAKALDMYRASLLASFLHYMLPDLERYPGALPSATGSAAAPPTSDSPAAPRTSLMPVVLGPPGETVPHSSLFFMIDEVCRVFCDELPRHVLGPDGFDYRGLREALVQSESLGRPMMLLGTALAFQSLCEWLAREAERFYLPEGSRVMETGGTKGSATATTPSALRAALADRLGIDASAIVGEYGMTEACSQFYEGTLRARQDGCKVAAEDESESESRRLKFGPPWVRAVICDPETLEPVAPGTPGVLRLADLANRCTISFLQTEDLAMAPGKGRSGPGSAPFVYLGRLAGAEARGCSLVAEEWARATAGYGS